MNELKELLKYIELLEKADMLKRSKSDLPVSGSYISWSYLKDAIKELESSL